MQIIIKTYSYLNIDYPKGNVESNIDLSLK